MERELLKFSKQKLRHFVVDKLLLERYFILKKYLNVATNLPSSTTMPISHVKQRGNEVRNTYKKLRFIKQVTMKIISTFSDNDRSKLGILLQVNRNNIINRNTEKSGHISN